MKDRQRIKVLLIEDNSFSAKMIHKMLSADSNIIFEFFHADQLSKGFECLERELIDVILLDLGLPDSQGMDTLSSILPRAHQIPIIVVTAMTDKELAIRTVKAGAQDYLIKGEINSPLLNRSILYAIERKRIEQELFQSEGKYKSILESMQEGYFEVDIKGSFIFFNDSVCQIIGYPKEELMGMNYRKYTDNETAKRIFQTFNRVYLTGKSQKEVDWYITRKEGGKRFIEVSVSLLEDLLDKPIGFRGILRDVSERKQAEDKIQQTLESLRKAVGTTIQVLVSAVESRDPYTAGHQSRSADLARTIATEMGLAQEIIEGIRMAGIIHDIGKLSIPAEILSKPSKLTDLEFSLIKVHVQSGYEMLKDVESSWPLAEIVYQHHERINGSGYPRNLKGDEIIMEARIMAVADVVEAMASHRPYRAALGIEAALEEIENNNGILYDNAVVDACLKLFREKGYQLT